MPIDQKFNAPLPRDPNSIPIIADEAPDGLKAVPVVLVSKTASTYVYGGAVAKYPFSGNANVTQTFPEQMKGLVISNDHTTTALTFTVNGDTYTVKAGEVFEEFFEPFTSVVINTTVPFRAYGRL